LQKEERKQEKERERKRFMHAFMSRVSRTLPAKKNKQTKKQNKKRKEKGTGRVFKCEGRNPWGQILGGATPRIKGRTSKKVLEGAEGRERMQPVKLLTDMSSFSSLWHPW
jgi:hypothetical protein